MFTVIYVQEYEIYGGPTYGTEYSMESACMYCGTGAKRVGSLMLSINRPPKADIFSTLDGEIIISKNVANVLRSEGLTCMENTLHKKSMKELPLEVITSEAALPKYSSKTTGCKHSRYCSHCERDGYWASSQCPIVFHYDQVDPKMLTKDVLCTYEHFGVSKLREPFNESVFASPMLIISERMRDIFEGLKLSGIKYYDVLFD